MSSILVVEGGWSVARLLRIALRREGYHIVMISSGDDAVQFALREMPSLIILDTMLPGVDGYALIQLLRDHPKCMHIPIIMLSAYTSLPEKVRALELGVDSYITKPFIQDELLAHVRRQLLRVQQTSLSPLTRLPGGLQLERAIDYKLRSAEPWSVLYLDLDHFKAFNDVYGFLAGNDMILLVGHICQRIVYEYGNSDDFVGHVGGDDFVIVTTPDREQIICERIQEQYKQESMLLYREEDLAHGVIVGIDRKGKAFQSPLVSLSIGIVSDQLRFAPSIDEVGTLAAEAKLRAKQSDDNIFCISSPCQLRPEYVANLSSSTPLKFLEQVKHDIFPYAREDALAEI